MHLMVDASGIPASPHVHIWAYAWHGGLCSRESRAYSSSKSLLDCCWRWRAAFWLAAGSPRHRDWHWVADKLDTAVLIAAALFW